MKIKKSFYEAKPFVLLVIAGFALMQPYKNLTGIASCVLLAGCALTILYWRMGYRGIIK